MEEEHRGDLHFLTHHLRVHAMKITYHFNISLDHLAEEVFDFSSVKSFFPPYFRLYSLEGSHCEHPTSLSREYLFTRSHGDHVCN